MRYLIGVIVGLLLLGNVFAYSTFEEADSAALEKWNSGDWAGARADLQEVIVLASANVDKGRAQLRIAETYFYEKDYENAKAECEKFLAMPDIDNVNGGRMRLGEILIALGDTADGIVFLEGVLNSDAAYVQKSECWEVLVGLVSYADILENLTEVSDWTGFYFRALCKEQLSDFAGAKVDLLESVKKTDVPENLKMIGQKLEKIKMILGEE